METTRVVRAAMAILGTIPTPGLQEEPVGQLAHSTTSTAMTCWVETVIRATPQVSLPFFWTAPMVGTDCPLSAVLAAMAGIQTGAMTAYLADWLRAYVSTTQALASQPAQIVTAMQFWRVTPR